MIFKGAVQYQSQAGETVTITVNKPDGTTETFTATTLADKTYSVVRELEAGNYNATANVPEDANYLSATSLPASFIVSKSARTLTLVVDVA